MLLNISCYCFCQCCCIISLRHEAKRKNNERKSNMNIFLMRNETFENRNGMTFSNDFVEKRTSEYFVFISIEINLFRCFWFLFLRYSMLTRENVPRTQICYIAMHGVYGIFNGETNSPHQKFKNQIKIRTLHKFHWFYLWLIKSNKYG